MIIKFDNYQLNEKIYLEEKPKEVSILFMDLVQSSKKWIDDETEMLKIITNISELFDKHINDYNGIIIKSIGDAYMMKFDTLYDSVDFALFIQKLLKNEPIMMKKDKVQFRIGICYGNVYEIKQDIQNFKLVDYLGNVCNTAARIESKVSEEGMVAFATTIKKKDDKLDKLLDVYDVDMVSFTNKGDEHKRSFRMLSDIQKHTFKNIKELKGINEIEVYKINI